MSRAVLLRFPQEMRDQVERSLSVPHAEPQGAPAGWRWAELSGRLVELSGQGAGAALTLAFGLVLDAQRAGEAVAWIEATESSFFPPDAAAGGVDLAALPVVRAPGAAAAGRAAALLLRSGAFGLVVLDLGADAALPMPLQSRLVGLAQKHGAAALFLTEKGAGTSSLGSLISLRAEARRVRTGDDAFTCELAAQKDKRRGPGWTHREVCHGPPGLR